MKQLVIMPGGFHPFHAGHLALYQSAEQAFPGADVKVAATNDTSARPFPFKLKEKLAQLAGVPPGKFYQVKSPFRADEITKSYNPADTQLIFVRSEKDADKPPVAGATKKDGTPAYLQPISDDMAPMTQHAYMAYLPTVEFGPGMTSATEIRSAWPTLNPKRKTALVMSLYPETQSNPKLAANVVDMLDTAMGAEAQDMAEGGADSSWSKGTDKITLQDILELTKHIKQINLPINDNLKSKLLHWDGNPEEMERVNQVTVSKQFPILIMVDEQDQIAWILDGNHRLHKAIQSQAKTIPAKLIRPSNLNDKAKKIFNIKEQGVAEVSNTHVAENADQAAVDALIKKHGWSMGRTVNGDLAFTWQGSKYVFYGERMRITLPDDRSISVVWGQKPDWQGRGTNELSFAQAVQKKLLTFDLSIWQALDRGQLTDSQAIQKFKAENERQAREAIAQGVNEASNQTNDSELNAIKNYAKRHYPNLAADPESAFDKWVQRSLMHSNVDDHEMDQKIRRMAAENASLKTKIQSLKQQADDSADYLDESR